jgi:hypothetical protein
VTGRPAQLRDLIFEWYQIAYQFEWYQIAYHSKIHQRRTLALTGDQRSAISDLAISDQR